MVWLLILGGWIAGATPNPSPQEWLEAINQVRKKGCYCGTTYSPPVTPLVWNSSLEQTAARHSQEMSNYGFFNHHSPRSGSPADRLKKAGIEWQVWSENLFRAQGYQPSAAEVVEAWVKSPGHCRNLLNPRITQTGIGVSNGYFTQLLIRPKPTK